MCKFVYMGQLLKALVKLIVKSLKRNRMYDTFDKGVQFCGIFIK